MATTGTEKHCRLCLMLMKGGTKASERLFLKRVEELSPKDHKPFPWTTDDFLQSKQNEIKRSKLSRANIQVLFPPTGKTDLTKWDLSLFCNVLTMFCDLKHLLCLDVKQLQTLRNDLCHVNEPNVDECKYKNYYETIEVCIKRIVDETGDQKTKTEIEKIVADIDSGPLSLADALKGMHVFYSMERGIQEKLEDLKDGNENILRRVEQIEDHIIQHHPEAQHNITIPGLDFFIELKNLSKESEDNISSVLVQLFEEVIRGEGEEGFQSSLPQDSYIKIREAVWKTFKLFLSKGWRITSTRHECIQLHVVCETFTSLATLFRECVSGSINKQLKDLKDAISLTEDGENVELETVVFKDEFWKVIDKSVAAFEDILSEDNDMDPALMANLQLYDNATTHSLSITVRKASDEEMQEVEGHVDSGLEACLKQIEIEIGKEFNLPHLSVQASYATKQSLTDSQTPVEKPDVVLPMEKDLEEKLRPLQRATSSKVKGSSVDQSEKHLHRIPAQSVDSTDKSGSELQTIALLEMIRAQIITARYLELAYLYMYEYSTIADKIKSIAQRARQLMEAVDLLEDSSYIMHKCLSLDPHVVFGNLQCLEDNKVAIERIQRGYTELQDEVKETIDYYDSFGKTNSQQLIKGLKPDDRWTDFIKLAQEEQAEAKKKTDALRLTFEEERIRLEKFRSSSTDVPGVYTATFKQKDRAEIYHKKETGKKKIVKTETGTFKRKDSSEIYHKKETGEKEIMKTETGTFKQKDSSGIYHKTETGEKKIMKTETGTFKQKDGSEIYHKKETREKEIMKTETDPERNETTIISMLRPGLALTGGIDLRKLKLCTMFRIGKPLIDIDILMKAYQDTQADKPDQTGRQPLVVNRMYQQGKEALDRLEKIKWLAGSEGTLCLREVHAQLRYIDIQLARQLDCFTGMIEPVKLLSVQTDAFFVRHHELFRKIAKDWNHVSEWYLCCKLSKKLKKLKTSYEFTSISKEFNFASPRYSRQGLFCKIENEISVLYPTKASGKDTTDEKIAKGSLFTQYIGPSVASVKSNRKEQVSNACISSESLSSEQKLFSEGKVMYATPNSDKSQREDTYPKKAYLKLQTEQNQPESQFKCVLL